MIYLASPYSDPDPVVRQQRFEAAAREAGLMMAEGRTVFCPIAHGHPIAEAADIPGDWACWMDTSKTILRVCDELVVLQLDGWDQSEGVQAEIDDAIFREMKVTMRKPTP